MVIGDLDRIIKLRPIIRTNHAGNKEQAEEGALQQVKDDVKALMEQGKGLLPLLQKGFVCADSEVVVKEEVTVPEVISYELTDGKWFSIAGSKNFGFKLVSKKPPKEG